MKATEHLMAEEKKNLESLLKENLELTRAMARDMKKIKRFMVWRMIASWLWLIIIIAPIILAAIYLPPVFKDIVDAYRGLFGDQGNQELFQIFKSLK